MKNYVIAAIVGIALVFGGTYAFSQEAPAEKCIEFATAIRPELEKAGVTVNIVPAGVVEGLVAARGLPPNAVEGFTLYRDDMGDNSQLVVVNPDGCTAWVSPVMTHERVNQFLGVNDV